MLPDLISDWVGWLVGPPCFRIYGKGRREKHWRIINIFATHRRDVDSRWPLWRGTCTTWSDQAIVVGQDFALAVLCEQMKKAASQDHPVEVAGGRLSWIFRRAGAGIPAFPSASEVLAHECGHTWQARRMGWFYLPVVGSVTLFREGPYPWNHFENEASEEGLFGGIVKGSVNPLLLDRVNQLDKPDVE